jgi:release factor glutamine methyltransferase
MSPVATLVGTIADALREAAARLRQASESPRLDAEVLLATVLARPRSALLANGDAALAEPAAAQFRQLVTERRRGVPVAYLTGTREFWSLPLRVTPAVLVPRPETEELVEQVLACVPAESPLRILDLGTGSGAIALAIASERPLARITAVDLSADALAIARSNAMALGIDRIDWRCGSWFSPVAGERFDLIVSNPPYIAADDPALATLRFEPALALSPGGDGMAAFAAIVAGAPGHLVPGGRIALEHGADQAAALGALLVAHGFDALAAHRDRAGRARAVLATLPLPQP